MVFCTLEAQDALTLCVEVGGREAGTGGARRGGPGRGVLLALGRREALQLPLLDAWLFLAPSKPSEGVTLLKTRTWELPGFHRLPLLSS